MAESSASPYSDRLSSLSPPSGSAASISDEAGVGEWEDSDLYSEATQSDYEAVEQDVEPEGSIHSQREFETDLDATPSALSSGIETWTPSPPPSGQNNLPSARTSNVGSISVQSLLSGSVTASESASGSYRSVVPLGVDELEAHLAQDLEDYSDEEIDSDDLEFDLQGFGHHYHLHRLQDHDHLHEDVDIDLLSDHSVAQGDSASEHDIDEGLVEDEDGRLQFAVPSLSASPNYDLGADDAEHRPSPSLHHFHHRHRHIIDLTPPPHVFPFPPLNLRNTSPRQFLYRHGSSGFGSPDPFRINRRSATPRNRQHQLSSLARPSRMDRNDGLNIATGPASGIGSQRDQLIGIELGRQSRDRTQRQAQGSSAAVSQASVIDLTFDDDDDDDDVPLASTAAPRPARNSQNLRRRASQQRNDHPRLARSDSSYIGSSSVPVIDLVTDSDDDDDTPTVTHQQPNPHAQRRSQDRASAHLNNRPHHHHHHHIHHHHHPHDHSRHFNIAGDIRSFINNFGLGFGQFLGNRPSLGAHAPLAARNNADDEDIPEIIMEMNHGGVPPNLNMPPLMPLHLNYNNPGFGANLDGQARSKPQHEPPPPPKEGFTRDTAEDQVVICPSCNQELLYDPEGEEDTAAPSKKPRSRKDKAEHHFWAVKACGHVYCKKCYDYRRPSSKNPVDVSFRADLSEGPRSKAKLYCAVDGCESEVTNKGAWVGIFL